MSNGIFSKERKINKEAYKKAVIQTLTAQRNYFLWAITGMPAYWLAEYFFDGTAYGNPAVATALTGWFAAFFALLALKKAKRDGRQVGEKPASVPETDEIDSFTLSRKNGKI